ncbi:MAG: AIR synthase family protein [Pseudomonadota bacterium]
MKVPFSLGKLDSNILQRLIQRYSLTDDRVLLGPRIGEDAAAIDLDGKILIVTTDPITFATTEIGYYSVMVNANDIATMGASPRWFSVTVLLPESNTTEELVDSIFQQIHKACKGLGVSLIGGHTEITYGLNRPILVGQMIGEVEKGAMITTGGARPGDAILLTKGICIEGTSIIAREKERELLSYEISMDLIKQAQHFLFDPGISIVEEARLAAEAGLVHAMHDITEGGLANGLYEISMAAGVQIEVEMDKVPIYNESRILCEVFGLNPLGVIASGSLLISISETEAEKILDLFKQRGIPITRIGHVKAYGPPSVTLLTSRGDEPLPYFQRDELSKLF